MTRDIEETVNDGDYVTQKDETLKAVIAYCVEKRDIERAYLENVPLLDNGILSWNHGKIKAYEDIIETLTRALESVVKAKGENQ